MFGEYAGYALPARYQNPAAEYRAALEGAAIFDYSYAAKLELTGPDAPGFVHNISTNDVKSLPLGGGCETYFCDARARALFVAWVYHIRLADRRNALWLETTPGRGPALIKHLDKFLISEAVEMADVTEQFAQIHVAGPNAKAILESAIADSLPNLAEFQHMERTFGASATCMLRRRDPLGVPGYDIVCLNERAEGVWRMLAAAGGVPAGLDTYEQLRIEAGSPVQGVDFDDTRFVMEVGRAPRAVSYSKGCFPGQEPIVMARDRAGRVNRSFLGLKVLGDVPVPAGAKLTRDGQDVGVVTSSTPTSRLSAPLALGYVHWKHIDVGTRLEAETPMGPQAVEVVGYPPVPALS
ncbi:Folate-dependent protein for Fe/S cluster synthesis/repair in oxidative stress [Fimbriiglobus ruber]|uniref:Folate-dependent protein for Fe/S cluster synthesis/repair in oxidative stress n=1 Tax=Fimbriiglobus ruber TaxID=1908690 RepID=A0A225DC69_9BACT|nr:Folate-dependent protein for Fe/S cluster synthesis/repair in oxidative stress [Fimbriiglobus ruber]